MSMTQVHTLSPVPGTPESVGTYNASMDGATKKGPQWWEHSSEGPQTIKVDLDAPLPVDKKGKPQELKARRGCRLVTAAIILRIFGFVGGFAMCALGGWILYKISAANSAGQMVQFAAFGVFLLLCGFITVLVETRTKRTMRGCLSTYVIISSYLSRGFFYLAIGALTFAVKDFKFPPPYVQIVWIAAGLMAIGGVNVLYYPIYWRYEREDVVIKSNPPKIANPEELIYDMQIYDPEKRNAAQALAAKQKEIETPKQEEHIVIPVAPEVGPSTS